MTTEKYLTKEIEDIAGMFLTFKLAKETYGVEILKVQEIIGMMKFTTVPRTPDFIKGVVNLRGKVIPIIDLRLKFNLEEIEYTELTCIIVVQLKTPTQTIITGIIVDEVSEVINITKEQIEPAPSFGTAVETDFILAIGKLTNNVVMLLDIDKVFTTQDTSITAEVAKKSIQE
jgi:purine-binding chemotaxis protein CheW